jgi:hypothetical protein
MPDVTPVVAAPVEAAPAPVQEATAKPKADFRDVKIRRISQSDGTAPVKVDPPTYSIPSAVPSEGTQTGNADGVGTEPGVAAGETATDGKPTTSIERQFKALHKQKQKIRAREAEVVKKNAEHDQILRDYRELAELRTKDPVGFLERVGLNLQQVNEAAKRRPQDPRTSAVEQRIADLEAQLAKRDQEALESQKKSTLAEIRQDIHKVVTDKREDYKYLNAYDGADEVYKTVLTFEEVHGRLPTPADVDQIAKGVDSAMKAKHEAAQKRLGGTAPAAAPRVTAPRSLSALRSAQAPEASKVLSRQEKIHQTAEIFRSFSKAQ